MYYIHFISATSICWIRKVAAIRLSYTRTHMHKHTAIVLLELFSYQLYPWFYSTAFFRTHSTNPCLMLLYHCACHTFIQFHLHDTSSWLLHHHCTYGYTFVACILYTNLSAIPFPYDCFHFFSCVLFFFLTVCFKINHHYAKTHQCSFLIKLKKDKKV